MESTQRASDFYTRGTTGVLTSILSTEEPRAYSGDVGLEIFEALVVFIGIVGTLANGIVLSMLLMSAEPKKLSGVNMLFINQMSLDLFSCVWLVIVFAIKMSNLYLIGSSGYWVCVFIVSENFVFYGLVGSVINLTNIAVERYTMIVHPIWHKKHFKPWMTYVAIAFAWIAGMLESQIAMSTTSVIVNGQCFQLAIWPNHAIELFYSARTIILYFVLVLIILMYCYGRILVAVRHQTRVFIVQLANNPLARTGRERNLRVQMNTVKTMIAVSLSFVACWLPCHTYSFIQMVATNTNYSSVVYYVTMLLIFLNVSLNPFIYAVNYEVIKHQWRRLAKCSSQIDAADQAQVVTVQTLA
jgi:hypothetical protein